MISFTEEQIYDIRSAGIIPVVSPENPGELKTLMAALSSTEVRCIEITLRCEFAPEAIKRIKQEYPHITVGAGTVKNMECARLAIDSGADFLVSPGTVDCALTGQEKINILLSLALTLSAHAGAWSFWPVNNIYGIFIAGALVVKLIKSEKNCLKFVYAVFAAWMLYCAFMSLYMPRVIPMISLTGIVIAGYITDRKMWKN